jgi:streptogramin lyase
MGHPPLRVFLSYTSELRETPRGRSYFAAAVDAVIRAGHALTAMAYFSASDVEPAARCAELIAEADVYVAIIGHRYGTLVPDQGGRSYTEFEFDTATGLGHERLVFLLADDAEAHPGAAPPDVPVRDGRQLEFRQRLQTCSGLVTAGFRSPDSLETVLCHSLVEFAARQAVAAPNARTPSLRAWLLVPIALGLVLLVLMAASVTDTPQQVLNDRTRLPIQVIGVVRALVLLISTLGLTEVVAHVVGSPGFVTAIGAWWRRQPVRAMPRTRLAPWIAGMAPAAILIALLAARPLLDGVLPGIIAAPVKWQVTVIDLGEQYAPRAATVAPDGAVWFIDNDPGGAFVGRLDSTRHVTRYDVPNPPQLLGSQIAVSADGTVWLGTYEGTGITRITPDGLVVAYRVTDNRVNGLSLGPDGNIWFTQPDWNTFGKMTPAGVVTRYPASNYPYEMAVARGQVWFAEDAGNRLARATLDGILSFFPVPTPNASIGRLAADRAGNVWFTEVAADSIGRVNPDGTVREFQIQTRNVGLGDIGPGPNGSMWFTETNTSTIGLIGPTGRITEMPLDKGIAPINLAAAPNGSVWFMGPGAHVIGHAILTR